MRFKNFDLNLLVVFDAVYREGNLTRASEALSITQPAVSNALHRLRQQFDDPLFVRSGKEMVPTPTARNMVVPVRRVLGELNDIVTDPRDFDPSTSGRTFNISMSEVQASLLMATIAPVLTQTAPGVRLRFFRVERDEVETELASGRLDLAVDVTNFAPASSEQQILNEEPYVCVLRRGHPMAGAPLSLEEYLSLTHITVSGRRRGGGYAESGLAAMGKRINSALRFQTYPPAFQAVIHSDLTLTAPQLLAAQHDVETHPLPFDLPPVRHCMFWHRSAEDDAGNRWLRGVLAAAAG